MIDIYNGGTFVLGSSLGTLVYWSDRRQWRRHRPEPRRVAPGA